MSDIAIGRPVLLHVSFRLRYCLWGCSCLIQEPSRLRRFVYLSVCLGCVRVPQLRGALQPYTVQGRGLATSASHSGGMWKADRCVSLRVHQGRRTEGTFGPACCSGCENDLLVIDGSCRDTDDATTLNKCQRL